MWNSQAAHVSALLLSANINPAISPFSADSSAGKNYYTDYGLDAGYQFLGDPNIVTAYLLYVHEDQDLKGSFSTGKSSQPSNALNQLNANASCFYQNTYGVSVGWQYTWGTANPLLFPPAPITGSANGKPNSNAFIFEPTGYPSARRTCWARPFVT